jgi:L-malate glycosyltransferase
MKIAIVSTMQSSAWGGSEELWAAMANQALDNAVDVLISVYHWPSIPPKLLELERKGAQVIRQSHPKSQQKRTKIQRALGKFYASISKRFSVSSVRSTLFDNLFSLKPDIVLINQGATYESVRLKNFLTELYAAEVPYIVICHMNRDSLIPELSIRTAAQYFFANACFVAFVSDHNLKTTERQLATKLTNAIIVRNPVNLSEVSCVPWPSSNIFHMASVARLQVSFKGQDILFEVLGNQLWKSREWRLRLYGSGPDKEYLEKLAVHYGIEKRIDFFGFVEDIRAVWSDNHFLVLPSRAEGIPLSLVEAMLCGRPSIVTDVGGNAEWVEEGQTGFIAEAPTAKSFGAALERAWLARNSLKEVGTHAHDVALTLFDEAPGKSLLQVVLDSAHSNGIPVSS